MNRFVVVVAEDSTDCRVLKKVDPAKKREYFANIVDITITKEAVVTAHAGHK